MSPLGVEIRAVRDGDIDALLADIRAPDLAEAEALFGPGMVRSALTESLANSAMAWTGECSDGLAWIFGVAPAHGLMGDIGLPWMVGTRLVDRERRALTLLTPAYIARMLAAFPTLTNIVDARNTKSIRWLRHVGFELMPAEPMGVAGQPFHLFVMRA